MTQQKAGCLVGDGVDGWMRGLLAGGWIMDDRYCLTLVWFDLQMSLQWEFAASLVIWETVPTFSIQDLFGKPLGHCEQWPWK